MAKHKPSVVWLFRKAGKYPNGQVQTVDNKTLQIVVFPDDYDNGVNSYGFQISRHDARLLARRINECLEKTK